MTRFIKHIHNYTALWLSGAVIFLYFSLFYTLGFKLTKFMADSVALFFTSFVAFMTFVPAMKAIRGGVQSAAERFLFSYWLIWVLVVIHRIWITYLGLMGRPTDLVESWGSGLIAIMFGISGGYAMAAPVTGPNKLERNHIISMVIAGTISGIIIGIAIGVYLIAGWVD